ncbi:hypothetical protein F5148DRAFT_1292605 [Russula earlei]|uniref:Uncharacterized protein n=1 Tax=Russula earlei TaxID=71964 RepID=A0ACC0TT63_9AGAM|nr:hypothetical protein F5148DRAFT_1292605 [Russula earlei]
MTAQVDHCRRHLQRRLRPTLVRLQVGARLLQPSTYGTTSSPFARASLSLSIPSATSLLGLHHTPILSSSRSRPSTTPFHPTLASSIIIVLAPVTSRHADPDDAFVVVITALSEGSLPTALRPVVIVAPPHARGLAVGGIGFWYALD